MSATQNNKATGVDGKQTSTSKNINELIHDARAPLNRISMQAELIKLVLENNMPPEKALEAATKIIHSCQECSQFLEQISNQ